MPDAFAITSPTNTVTVDQATRKGQSTFTVTNATGRPVRIRGGVAVAGDAKAEWFTIAGGAEQDCVIGGTVQFAVDVTVPTAGPAGTFPVKFTAAAEDRPEEDYAEFPWSVSVPAAIEERTKFPVWIPFAALGVILLIVLIFVGKNIFDGGDKKNIATTASTTTSTIAKVAVPDVRGLSPAVGEQKIKDAGLTPKFTYQDKVPGAQEHVCIGTTTPAPGDTVNPGSEVAYIVTACGNGPLPTIPPDFDKFCKRVPEFCVAQKPKPYVIDDWRQQQIRPGG
jgi:hypothetical protein